MTSKLKVLSIAMLIAICARVEAQHEPYKIHDTVPVILNGPYLVAPTEDGVTVAWRTDTPCHSKILFGEGDSLTSEIEPQEHGLIPVKTIHAIRLSGLTPGSTYSYQVSSTRVVRLKGYWPEKGKAVQSAVYHFRLSSPEQDRITFSFLTDTQHEDVRRLNKNLQLVNWESIDFLAHGGDTVDTVENEDQFFDAFLGPISQALNHSKPLVFVRGNHDMRGPFARHVFDYLPTETGQFYYAFDAGPIHFVVLDTGEDKDDATNVYAGLLKGKAYRDEEFQWFQKHVKESKRLQVAPFRVVLLHAPNWGWVNDENDKWTQLANEARVDLVIAGHRHRFSKTDPGERGNDYTILVVGQDQVGEVKASQEKLEVVVTGPDQLTVDSFTLTPQRD